MIVQLERFAYTPMGTFGRLTVPEGLWYTVERPWADNQPRVSCIPTGLYPLVLGRYNRGDYPAYEVKNVPGRSLIKIHVANSMDDVLGCIAPGKALGWIHEKWAVSRSREAYEEFMALMDDVAEAQIRITNLGALG